MDGVIEHCFKRTASCHAGHTGTHLITKVKQFWALLGLGWVTT
jgi:hypothetical protein